MRRYVARSIAVLLVLLIAGWTTDVRADDNSVENIWVDGHQVTAVIDGVPRVGDGPAIRRYHDSGRFDADRAAVTRAALWKLRDIVAAECPAGTIECRTRRIAIIVDIDDTLLDWYPAYAKADFDLPGATRQAGVQSCVTPVIAPVRSLVDEAKRLGVAVLIVTGRRNPVRAATESCLARRGVIGWQALVMRDKAQDSLPAATYKQQAFVQLRKAGWRIVLSIGDQPGDVTGGSTTARYLLPNPLYRSR